MGHLQTNTSEYHESVKNLSIKAGSELTLSNDALRAVLCDVLDKGMLFRFKARGSSMSPFLKDGDVLTICPKRQNFFGKGDVVAYRHKMPNKILIHRIVGKKNGLYMLKGDNTAGITDLVCEKDILGYVSKVERNGEKAHFGLGPERYLISLLTRFELLYPLMLPFRKIFRPMVKRFLF
jgi:signal peptidase I